MSIIPHTHGESPFDAIKRTDERGEYWSARDLMPLMGYDKWERFAGSVERAVLSMQAQGYNPDVEASRLREAFGKTNQRREDFRLTRFAAYLVAMNGDPRKPEVAAAQAYFAVRTRQAETSSATVAELSRRDLARMVIDAEVGWIYRAGDRNQWHAYQTQIDNGRLAHKLSGPFLNHRTGALEIPAPTIRITPKGLSALHRLLGGVDDLDALVALDDREAA